MQRSRKDILLAALRRNRGYDGDPGEWANVKIYEAQFGDGSVLAFPSSVAPSVRELSKTRENELEPCVWTVKFPMFTAIRIDQVVAIWEVDLDEASSAGASEGTTSE